MIAMASTMAANSILIDDFSTADGRAQIGGEWQGFTDRVMGGLSDIRAGLIQEDGNIVLRMEGNLSLENNGGFIQVRLPFDARRVGVDLESYRGLRVTYRENLPGDYVVHIRTRSNPRPWALHAAEISGGRPQGGTGYNTVDLPWSSFIGDQTRTRRLPVDEITSLAIVATKTPGPISIDISRIELF